MELTSSGTGSRCRCRARLLIEPTSEPGAPGRLATPDRSGRSSTCWDAALETVSWELIFVDDDLADRTAERVRECADGPGFLFRSGRKSLDTDSASETRPGRVGRCVQNHQCD